MKRVREVPRLPKRARDAHKGTFGTVLVVAGSRGMLGAAILCARGALRGGAGLVRACLPAGLMAPFTVAVPSATTVVREIAAMLAAARSADAVVVGPGLGQSLPSRLLLRHLQRLDVPMVLDADALNVSSPLRRPMRRGRRILTPHPREASRLLGCDTEEIQQDRERSVAALAQRSGGIVVLKGSGTLVCDGERLFVNSTGNPGMATGGSGDVLTGLIGALLAQGMPPFEAACLGVHVHGKAGDLVARRLSPAGLIAEDLPLAIAEVLR